MENRPNTATFWDSDAGHRLLFEQLLDGVFVVDEGRVAYVNQQLSDTLGRPRHELIGVPFDQLIVPEEREQIVARYQARLAGKKEPAQYEIHLLSPNAPICCFLNVRTLQISNHLVTIGSVRDITKQKAEIYKLESSQKELQSIFDQLPDVFYRTDMKGYITMISPVCEEAIGYSAKEMIGTLMADYYATPSDREKIVQAIAQGGGRVRQVEAALRHKNGNEIWVSTNAFIRFNEAGQPVCIEGVARDISERKRMEEQLWQLSITDMLTGIRNRHYFFTQGEEILSQMKRYNRRASLLVMDLDYFKQINDKHGHLAGDNALFAFTAVCQAQIRNCDLLARLGGEEFALLLPETGLQDAAILAERIRAATEKAGFIYEGKQLKFTVSIGVAEFDGQANSLSKLLHQADMAMYQAKNAGRNRVETGSHS